jgi:hypothetical protein
MNNSRDYGSSLRRTNVEAQRVTLLLRVMRFRSIAGNKNRFAGEDQRNSAALSQISWESADILMLKLRRNKQHIHRKADPSIVEEETPLLRHICVGENKNLSHGSRGD